MPVPATSPQSADDVPDFPEHDPQIDRARVKRFVIAGHNNLPAVKKMLAEDPTLINGAINWGNGDFKTALGGASHMGRRDIAEFLLEHNARMDIFAATDMTPDMLSKARENAEKNGFSNVAFRLGEIEALPVADQQNKPSATAGPPLFGSLLKHGRR